MYRLKSFSTLLLALSLAAGACLAQDNDKSEPQKFYKLDFVVKELEGGRTVNSRSYSMTVATPSNGKSSIRTSSQVPFQTSPGQWTRSGIDTNLDCFQITEIPAGLSLTVVAQVDSMLEEPSTAESGHPILRHNEWNSAVILPIKKPTVIFSSDDVASKRQMQVELTATPIK